MLIVKLLPPKRKSLGYLATTPLARYSFLGGFKACFVLHESPSFLRTSSRLTAGLKRFCRPRREMCAETKIARGVSCSGRKTTCRAGGSCATRLTASRVADNRDLKKKMCPSATTQHHVIISISRGATFCGTFFSTTHSDSREWLPVHRSMCTRVLPLRHKCMEVFDTGSANKMFQSQSLIEGQRHSLE